MARFVLPLASVGLMAIAACDSTAVFSNSTPSPSNSAESPAADLRAHMNLLFGEHVFVVAKLSAAAAAGRKDEYHSYAGLLALNGADLVDLITRSMGSSTGQQFSMTWNEGNDATVAYVVASSTHNQAATQAAAAKVTIYGADLAGFLKSSVQLSADADRSAATAVSDIESVMDDRASGSFTSLYQDLHAAYMHAAQLGDQIGIAIAHRFADRIPGDATQKAVDQRTGLDSLFQEYAYLMTMTSGAVLTGATAEQQPARTAVGLVIDLLAHQLGTSVDSTAKIRTAWLTQEIAILDYASAHSAGERESLRAVLLGPSALQLAGFMSLPANNVSEQVAAAVKVVDDQRDKVPAQIAIDDRAAALYLASFGDVITGVTAFQ